MNRAAPHLVSRKELWRALGRERFLKEEKRWDKELVNEKKVILGKVTYLWGTRRFVRRITSLVLTRKFQAGWLRLHS